MHTGRGGRRGAGASLSALLANEITRKFDIYGSKNRLLESNLRVIRSPARRAGPENLSGFPRPALKCLAYGRKEALTP